MLKMVERPYNVVAFFAREHGLNALQSLLNNSQYKIIALFTHRLKPKSEDPSRSIREDYPTYEEIANRHRIPLYAVDSSKEAEEMDSILRTLQFDLIASISWRRLIPEEHLKLPLFGGVNLHRGKLPDYAGKEPIKHALENGEETIEITAHILEPEIDGGKVLAVQKHPVCYQKDKTIDENVFRLKKEITPYFGPLLLDSLNRLVDLKTQVNWDRLKAVFVDLDGTLVDSVPILYNVYTDFLGKHHAKGSKEEFAELIGPSIEQIVVYLKKKYRLSEEQETLVNEYLHIIRQHLKKGLNLLPGAREFLHFVKEQGLQLALVTSSQKALTDDFIKSQNLDGVFDLIVTVDDSQKGKPDPEVYLKALKQLSLFPEDVLAIEDSPNGILAALGAKIPTWQIVLNNTSNKNLCFQVKDWAQILDLFRGHYA